MKHPLFITGMGRSGTTLLDKLLGNLVEVDSFSQPLPLLLVQLKADFLISQNMTDYRLNYPLSDQQFENRFDVAEFTHFLNTKCLSRDYIEAVLTKMIDYSGQYFKPNDKMASVCDWHSGTVAEFAKHYFTIHASSNQSGSSGFAWKEALSESFIPYFIGQEFAILLIIRDPRDVLVSFNHTKAIPFANTARPLLWIARQWRKSVAYKHQFADASQMNMVRYEDLVVNPDSFLYDWACWLGVNAPKKSIQLSNKDHQQWLGNSSFIQHYGISTQSVGRHRSILSVPMRSFLEALCYAEMRSLGYTPEIHLNEVETLLQAGPPEDYLEREALAHYTYCDQRQHEELARWRALTTADACFNAAHFIFERNYQTLRQQVKL